MNEEVEPFENRLKRLPQRQVPGEWRKEILSAASKPQAVLRLAVSSNSFLSNLNRRLTAIFWPHPVAWGALAAIWILISAVNFSIRDEAPVLAEKNPTPSPEMLTELKAQQRLSVELIGENASASGDANRQKKFVPKPRGERRERMTA